MTTTCINFEDHLDVPCPICKQDFDQEDITRRSVIISCGHIFHTVCLAFLFVPVGVSQYNQGYNNGRCPMCHAQLFHMIYKFYTQEIVAKREENLQQELTLCHERLAAL